MRDVLWEIVRESSEDSTLCKSLKYSGNNKIAIIAAAVPVHRYT